MYIICTRIYRGSLHTACSQNSHLLLHPSLHLHVHVHVVLILYNEQCIYIHRHTYPVAYFRDITVTRLRILNTLTFFFIIIMINLHVHVPAQDRGQGHHWGVQILEGDVQVAFAETVDGPLGAEKVALVVGSLRGEVVGVILVGGPPASREEGGNRTIVSRDRMDCVFCF